MPIEVTVPAISGEPAEIYLSEWLVAVGDEVSADVPLVLIEADKAQVEVVAPASGRVIALHAAPEDQLKVGQVIAVLEST